jgi:predicted metallopeptidase
MEYIDAPEAAQEVDAIVRVLGWGHLDLARIRIVRSRGSRSRRILARCHGLPKALQAGLGLAPHYVIELVAENYDRLPRDEQIKTLIHELLHIPASFGGGFRHHDFVRARRVNAYYERYRVARQPPHEGAAAAGCAATH